MSEHLLPGDEQDLLAGEDKNDYQKITGTLLWISNTVRPDICFSVGTLARYMSKPAKQHMRAALKVLGYLEQTPDNVLRLGFAKDELSPLVTYTDANWASDPTTGRRSTSGSVTIVFGSVIGWKSHVQRCVALSAVEAEFVAASEAARETLFYKYLLENIGIQIGTPLILTDNVGCIQVSKDPAQHWKLKHIDTKYQFIRDHVREGSLGIRHIGTKANLADMFTKPVNKVAISNTNARIGLIRPQSLREAVKDTSIAVIDSADKGETTSRADQVGHSAVQGSV
jgi:hypothetical protein